MKKALRSRGVRIVLFTGGIVALLGYVGWRAMQPKFKFATDAEVRAQVDPRLLKPIERDPEAEKRYERFKKVLVQQGPWPQRRVAEALAISRQGKLQAPPTDDIWGAESFPNFASIRGLMKERAAAARGTAKAQPSQTTQDLLEAIEINDAYLSSATFMVEMLVSNAGERLLDSAILDVTPTLDTDSLGLLVRGLERRTSLPGLWKAATVREFQERTLPILPDLLTRRKIETMPDEGTYDALETTRLLSGIHAAFLDGIDKSIPNSPLPVDVEAGDLAASVPVDDSESLDPGIEKSVRHFWYVVRVNNHPNSTGAGMVAVDARSYLEILARWRTDRDTLLAFLRAEIYRRKHGRLPASLAEVGGGTDHYTQQPLRYDPKRGLIWSVGRDLKDDGGSVSGNWAPKDPDYGLILPKP